MTELTKCELCGEPMPAGEQMFKFHGYSGPCPVMGATQAPKASPAVSGAEPYGRVTTHSQTGQQFFYRWPEPPYLDNASECVTVYAERPSGAELPVLTDAQINAIANYFEVGSRESAAWSFSWHDFARAILAASSRSTESAYVVNAPTLQTPLSPDAGFPFPVPR